MASYEEMIADLSAAFRERDFGRVKPWLDPAIVFDWSRSIGVDAGTYEGIASVAGFFRTFLEAWEDADWEVADAERLGDGRILVSSRLRARGRTSGVAVHASGAQLWEARGGKLVRVTMFQSREDAAAAAGIGGAGADPERERRLRLLADARLYFVCEARPRGDDARPLLDAALRGGADLIQLREKSLSDAELVAAARSFRAAADEHGALFILNDRPDLVAACEADGVHVGQEDVPVAEARRIAGPAALVGLSTHSPDEVDAAAAARDAERADQISVGPVWATPTKEGRPATGLGLIEHAARSAAALPWFAIGGIAPENVGEVVRAGARRVVVVRAIRDATDPEAAARRLRAALAE